MIKEKFIYKFKSKNRGKDINKVRDRFYMSKKELKIKKVEIEHLEQYNQLLRYVFQVTNKELQESGWREKEIMTAKYPTLKKAEVIGYFDGEDLVSQVAVYPMRVRIFNKTYEMGGLTGVGTYPEYANRGLMHNLICKAVEDMKNRGQSISYLYPYSIPYYRRKGWEIISDKITFEINDYQLPKNKKVVGEVKRVEVDSEELKEAYDIFSMQTHGALIRDSLAWNEYWLWDSNDLMAAVYYSEKNIPNGYVIYWIKDEVFYIKDMIFINEEARTGLWNFVSAHFSMIKKVIGNTYTDEPLAFLFEDADIREVISPYFMARIVDLEKFIKEYPFKVDTMEREWTFNIEDPILSCNTGCFKLIIDRKGKGGIVKLEEKTEDKIDIQTMTTMLLGYKRPEYLYKIGRLNCSEKTLDMLEDAIEQQTPYFSDYF